MQYPWTLQIVVAVSMTCAFPRDVYDPEYHWTMKGDINIGAIMTIHSSRDLFNCSKRIEDPKHVQNVEALRFAVEEINNNSIILPNISLGFHILDDCLSPSMALARAIQFMPRKVRFKGICHWPDCDILKIKRDDDDIFYDVVGVIGTYTSQLSIIVADVLSLYRLPQISHTATSNVLSDKYRFPFFFRMVPPDKYQAMVISNVLEHFNWTHVSILYSDGNYGRDGLKSLSSILKTRKADGNICIENTIEISKGANTEDILKYLERLKTSTTKVVIAFVDIDHAVELIKGLKSSGMGNEFIWVGSDSFSLVFEEDPNWCKYVPSAIMIQPYSNQLDKFRVYMSHLNTNGNLSHIDNPWLRELSQRQDLNNDGSTDLQESNVFGAFRSSFVDTFLIDSVYAFAYALDKLVKTKCLEELNNGNTKSIVECIDQNGIYEELKHVRFNGSRGELEFNDKGDVMSKYEINQCANSYNYKSYRNLIGYWDMANETLDIITENLAWPEKDVPVSSCPRPCSDSMGTIYYFAKETCCWECVTCKVNEIVSSNATRCEVCPEFYWPDETKRTQCLRIDPFYYGLHDAVSIGLCAAAVAGVIFCIVVTATFIKYRQEHVIKCISIELSSLILFGTILTYTLTASFLSQPNIYKCYINHVGFSLSVTIIYAPLLVKTSRIFRIFNAGRRTTRKPVFISNISQVLISTLLIFIQIAIVIITTSLQPPEVTLQMPKKTEKFVELFCNIPKAGLLSSLSYNLILVLICTFYAFKTRKLPNNYKESRYIAYCVDMTLMIWITFVPTYFTTSRAAAKVTILAVSLVLNATVTVVCLFIPRLYSLHKSLKSSCSSNGHHYKDFRIVKHVVKRNRSFDFKENISENDTHLRVSSAVTIMSDMVHTYNDVSIPGGPPSKMCLELEDVTFQQESSE